MLYKIVNFLTLLTLVFKLIFSLLFFAIQYSLLKLKLINLISPLLVLILLSIWAINWQLWQSKKPGQISITPALSHNPEEQMFKLNQEQLLKTKNIYLQLEKEQGYSRDILFNLGKILEVNDRVLAEEKFTAANQLDPNYP